MAISQAMLGLNARNYLYIRAFNKRSQKTVADNKLLTKERLFATAVPTSLVLATFRSPDDIRNFDWKTLPTSFAIKPAFELV